jgi:hypothetical protein
MSVLKDNMIMELQLKGFSEKTQKAYISHVTAFKKHFGQSPDKLGINEIKQYLHYLIMVRKYRVVLSNSRITDLKDDKVTFKWRDYKDNNKPKLMTLDAFEFIRRFLFHVLPNGFVKIRHYGILSNRNRKTKLEKCKKLLGVPVENKLKSKVKETWEELLLRISQVDTRIFPCCGKGHMVLKETIFPHSGSPPNKKAIRA